MSGAGRPPGLQVGTTKPQSREERRAAAARVRADDVEPETAPPESAPPPADPSPAALTPQPPAAPAAEPAAVIPQQPLQLKARKRNAKRPFATQLRPDTIERLDWIKNHGYALTDTVDDAINDYLDRAGVPRLGESE